LLKRRKLRGRSKEGRIRSTDRRFKRSLTRMELPSSKSSKDSNRNKKLNLGKRLLDRNLKSSRKLGRSKKGSKS
jgi:hypothetical protein